VSGRSACGAPWEPEIPHPLAVSARSTGHELAAGASAFSSPTRSTSAIGTLPFLGPAYEGRFRVKVDIKLALSYTTMLLATAILVWSGY